MPFLASFAVEKFLRQSPHHPMSCGWSSDRITPSPERDLMQFITQVSIRDTHYQQTKGTWYHQRREKFIEIDPFCT